MAPPPPGYAYALSSDQGQIQGGEIGAIAP